MFVFNIISNIRAYGVFENEFKTLFEAKGTEI
jgi:hypothetical protein